MKFEVISNLAANLIAKINEIEHGNTHYYKGAREGVQELLNAIKITEEKEAEGPNNAAESTVPKVKAKPAKS